VQSKTGQGYKTNTIEITAIQELIKGDLSRTGPGFRDVTPSNLLFIIKTQLTIILGYLEAKARLYT
jgi:hypothetical protein